MTNEIKLELNVRQKVKEFLLTKEVYNDITIYTDKPNDPKGVKVILINTLFALKGKNDQIDGYININLKDTDLLWIDYISELTQLYLDHTIIDNYIFEFSNEHLFKISPELYFKNIKFKFTTI